MQFGLSIVAAVWRWGTLEMSSLGLVHTDMFTFKLMYFSFYSINTSFQECTHNLFKVSNKNSLRKVEMQNRHSS